MGAPEPSPPGTLGAGIDGATEATGGGERHRITPRRPGRPPKKPPRLSKHQPTPNHTNLALSVPGAQLAYNTKLLSAKAGP